MPDRHTGGGNRKGGRRRFGSVRKLPSGRYQARYTGPDGDVHRAPVTFETKGDALAWLDTRSAAITESRWKPAPPEQKAPAPRFSDYATSWLKGRELKPRTRSEYTRIAAKLVETFGATRLDAITAADVREWHRAYGARHKTARAHAYALLRTILNSAVEEEIIDVNPARIRGAGTAKASRPIRPATLDEVDAIALAMPERYRAMVHVATWCAVRFGELTELRRKDVRIITDASGTPKSGVLRISRAVTWVKDDEEADAVGRDKARPIIGTPKSDAGDRDVAIPPHVLPVLVDHLERFARPGPNSLVFPNTEGGHLHHGSLYKVFRPARKAAGREDLRWHDLRHTGATLAAQAGATTRELMNRLGHTTAGVAMRYQHAVAERDQTIAAALSKLAGHDE